jgi:hypothetical protein
MDQKISPQINHSTSTPPMIIPDSFSIATLFPLAAILPNRLADPFKLVLIEENVSDYFEPVSPLFIVPPSWKTFDNWEKAPERKWKHTVLSITSCALALS